MANDFQFKRPFRPTTSGLTFQFENHTFEAFEGDSVATALLANGVTFSRMTPSKNNRRAPFCMMGNCFDCLVEIDTVPNRQACMEPVKDGMIIRRMYGKRSVKQTR